jgi:hypothetical protein
MKTVQIVLDTSLLSRIDRAAKRAGASRSRFIRESLERQLDSGEIDALAEAERRVWARQPPSKDERSAFNALSRSQARVLRQVAEGEDW